MKAGEWVALLVGLAAVFGTLAAIYKGRVRHILVAGCALLAVVGVAVGVISSVGKDGGSAQTSPQPASDAPGLPTSSVIADPAPVDPAPVSPEQSGAETEQYVSKLSVTDHDHDSSTGQWTSASRTIGGQEYGHSVSMTAGCQNDDGGDFWLDYSIDGKWRKIEGVVGVSDKSSSQSSGTYKIVDALTGNPVTQGSLAAGSGTKFTGSILGITRFRLFIHDPNAPKQMCGFERIATAVVWGDIKLTR